MGYVLVQGKSVTVGKMKVIPILKQNKTNQHCIPPAMPQCKEQKILTSNLRKSASDLCPLASLQLAGPILV
jgi:hypothetical protein